MQNKPLSRNCSDLVRFGKEALTHKLIFNLKQMTMGQKGRIGEEYQVAVLNTSWPSLL